MVGAAGDVAGEVVEVGSAVNNIKAGDKVVSMVDPRVSLALFPLCVVFSFWCLYLVCISSLLCTS